MQPDPRRIVTPAEAIARARIRPRAAPRARIAAGVGGWMRYGLIDRAGREVAGGEQHNLWTNNGLDQMAGTSFAGSNGLWASAAIGTGSTAPDVTDTGLVAQLATVNAMTFSRLTRTTDGEYIVQVLYEFDFGAGNGNLTEWAIRAQDGSTVARELFRDEVGDPVTVTKTSAYKLRMLYTWRILMGPVVATPVSFTITGVGVINGDMVLRGGDANPNASFGQGGWDGTALSGVMAAAAVANTQAFGAPVCSTVDAATSYVGGANVSGSTGASVMCSALTWGGYTAGAYERTLESAVWGTAKANGVVASLAILGTGGSSGNAGVVIAIDSADRWTKDSLHTLTVDDLITVAWGRA